MSYTKEQRAINSVNGYTKQQANSKIETGTISNNFTLPNKSGEHVRSIKREVPVHDEDLVNKKYVDDEIAAIPLPSDDLDDVCERGGVTDVNITTGNISCGTLTTSGNATIGAGAAGVDYQITFNGETNDGVFIWKEDEDYFQSQDHWLMNTDRRFYLRDTSTSFFHNGTGLTFVDDNRMWLYSTNLKVGKTAGTADIIFDALSSSNNGQFIWDVSADQWEFKDDLNMASGESIKVANTAVIDGSGYFIPKSSTDAAAPNNSIYYSTTQSKLVYKDSGGGINNLY